MIRPLLVARLGALAAACAQLQAQAGTPPQQPAAQAPAGTTALALRVLGVTADGKLVVDRGSRDLVHVGDRIELQPAQGPRLYAAVVQVDDRSALAELPAGTTPPPAGTKGELRLPQQRIAAARPRPAPAPAPARAPAAPTPTPEAPASRQPSQWPARDDGWQPGMPLLAAVKPLRPEERAPYVTGRVFGVVGFTGNTLTDGFEPYARVGTDLEAENAFDRGGTLHLDVELDYRRMLDDSQRGALLLRRLSYSLGGDRFDRDRYEFGRFLNPVFAELGIVDGAAWTRRLDDGSRVGASLGFLPVPDDEFQSFADLQLAAFGEWWLDGDGTTRAGAALQKTWHNGRSDRDAVLLSFDQAPIDGWQVHAGAHVDFFLGDDDIKGKGIGVTTGFCTFGRHFATTGFDLGYRHTSFPELLRHEFLPLPPDQLAADRFDRLTLDTYALLGDADRMHANVTGFVDEERTGGAADLGLALGDRFGKGSTLDVIAFGGRAQFERMVGGRVTLSRLVGSGHWQVLYELGWHRLDDRPSDGNDMFQHRLGASLDHRTDGGWVVGANLDATVWDQELGWSLQVTVHKNF